MHREPGEIDRAPDESAIDRALQMALAVEPSPEFVARVRVRITREPEQSVWRLPWAFVAAGAGALAIVAAVLILRPHQQPASRSVDGTVSTPEAVVPERSPQTVVARGFSPAVAGPAENPAVSRSAAKARREPEVLVSPAEMKGLRQLIALANQGDRGLELLLAAPADPAPIAGIGPVDIVIAPITIEPLESDTY